MLLSWRRGEGEKLKLEKLKAESSGSARDFGKMITWALLVFLIILPLIILTNLFTGISSLCSLCFLLF